MLVPISAQDIYEGEWEVLFNGQDLVGWTAKITGYPAGENFADTFRVEDGLLTVNYDGYEAFEGRFGHLFFETPYSHYALHIEYRFIGEQLMGGPAGWAERNSGVMLHSQAPETMSIDQDFPNSVEAQFLGGLSDGKPRPTANVCTPGTEIVVDGEVYPHHCLPSASATYDGDQWVNAVVVVMGGGSITHHVEGGEVLKYHNPHATDPHEKRAISSGYIALQSESHPVQFRQVRLLNLAGCKEPNATNYAPWVVKSEPGSCMYE